MRIFISCPYTVTAFINTLYVSQKLQCYTLKEYIDHLTLYTSQVVKRPLFYVSGRFTVNMSIV
jgi:hypothetical protein